MTLKFGSKHIEFEKGKAAVVVRPVEKLPGVTDSLIKAVRAGELDGHLSEARIKIIAARRSPNRSIVAG
jgi:hypothetical protein